jgi:hypothetical protein
MDDCMSKVRLYGATSGYVDLQAPSVAGDVTITLPNASGPFALESYVDSAIASIPGIGSNVVQTVKTDVFSTTSASFTNVTGLTVSITPSTATSKILIIAQLTISTNGTTDTGVNYALSGGNSGTYIGDAAGSRVRTIGGGAFTNGFYVHSHTVVYLDSPNTTSSVTYAAQLRRGSGGTIYLNRSATDTDNNNNSRGASSITAIEVAS